MKPDGSVVVKYLVRPASDGANKLDGSDPIVGNEDALYRPLAPKLVNIFSRRGHLAGNNSGW